MTENEKFYVIKLNDELYLDARIEPKTICARCTFTKDLDKAKRYIHSADARSTSEDLGGYVVEASYQLRRLEVKE